MRLISLFVLGGSSWLAACSQTVRNETKPAESSTTGGGTGSITAGAAGEAGVPTTSSDAGGSGGEAGGADTTNGSGGSGTAGSSGAGTGGADATGGAAGGDAGGTGGSDATGGDGGTATDGSGGTATDGSGGTATDGSGGTATDGSGGTATGGSGGSAEPPTLETETLPPADFNAPYSFGLDASGGQGTLEFSISGGALPEGLTLDPSGELSGTPVEGGSFTFTVEVEDEEGGSDSVDLELTVNRRRWLAYVADEDVLDEYRLYLVDLTSVVFTKELVSTGVPSGGTLPNVGLPFKFAPDGSKLVYLLDPGDGLYDLYMIDLSSGEPSAPQQLNDARPVSHLFDISPDGSYVAFTAEVSADSWETRAVDVSEGEPGTVERLGEADGWDINWVGNDLLAYSSPDGVRWHRRSDDGFSGAATIAVTEGYFHTVNPDTEQLMLHMATGQCTGVSYVVDFPAASYSRIPGDGTSSNTTYNKQLSHVTYPDGNGGFLVYATDEVDEPVGLVSPAGSCQASWSPGGDRVVHLSSDASPRVLVTNVSESGLTLPAVVSGDYAAVGNATNVVFIDNDRLTFNAGHEVLQSTIIGGVPGGAVVLNPEQPEAYSVNPPSVSPNTKWVGFSSNDAQDPGPFVVDISGSTAASPRRLLNAHTGFVDKCAFSPDSSRVAFRDSNLANSLYIGDLIHPTALARLVFRAECPNGGSGATDCHDVHSFQFQP